ncbi:hypothetical protein LCGC14_0544430 [marine sediment metagenome]|uniref:Uncharacterized protein n=1 Tax=marine sediment metagenome TaxID=412755 RepID=A0A0F9UD89_9ZZZZ
MTVKRISYDPHIIRVLCQQIVNMKRYNSECHSAKCAPCLKNMESLLEEKEVIDVQDN